MKKIFSIVITLLLSIVHGSNSHSVESLPDSLLTKDHVYEFTFSDPQKAQEIINQMREKKSIPEFMIDITEGDLHFNNGKYRQALIYYNKAIGSDSVKNNPTHYMDQLHRLISTYDCLNDVVKKTNCVELLMKYAENHNNEVMKSVACFNMGKILYYQEDKDRGYHYMNEAVEIMKKSDYKYKYDNLRYNYNTLLIMQKRDGLFNEALHTLELLEDVLFKENGEPHIAGLENKELKTLYAHKAVILSRLGRKAEAGSFYEKWKIIGKAYDKDNYLIMPYLFDNRKYDDIVFLNSQRENFLIQNNDTINYHMLTIKRNLARVYRKKGDFEKAASYFEELAILGDSIKIREQNSDALEFATIYETQEKEAQIQHQKSIVQKRNILLVSIFIVVILLGIILYIVFRNMQETKEKNKTLIKQIKEIQQYRKNYLLPIIKPDEGGNSTVTHKILNEDVFIEFLKLMNDEKLYQNARLTRDEVVLRLHTNKNILIEALKRNTGLSFNEYVNNLRLEESLTLLENSAINENLENIADRVGLSKSTFYRLFREKYAMTPSEYRFLTRKTEEKR